MRCRNIVKNKNTGKQNIVWFGSCGKNLAYQPISFTKFNDAGDPIIEGKNWQNCYLDVYVATEGPFLNQSDIWGEYPLFPSNRLYPSENLFPRSGETNIYFRYIEDTGAYEPVEKMPSDWKENYDKYYIAKFEANSDPVFDPDKTYYAFGNKIPAENYSDRSEGVRNSLIQRLSVIKGELWYKASYGLPLTEKIKNKGIYDSIIIDIVTTHPDVANLLSYNSYIDREKRAYHFEFTAMTIYNEELAIRYTI